MSIGVRLLGRSGIRVSEVCLGTMTFGTEWNWGADETVCREIYTAYREAGGNFVDTANLYNDGSSERILGKLLADERDRMVVGTKYTFPTDRADPNTSGSHRKSLRTSIEGSLRRLATDYIDVLWIHAWDRCTPLDETMRALDDLVRQGKVLAIGVSNMPAWAAATADVIAELRGWTRFCGVQVQYSLAERDPERELLPMARARDLAALAWSPLGRGKLTGKHDAEKLSPSQRQAVDAVTVVAGELDASPAQVAVAWVLHQGLIPVLGARTFDQIHDNLGALDVRFDDDQLRRLDDATRIDRGYPYEWLDEEHRRSVFTPEGVTAGAISRIER